MHLANILSLPFPISVSDKLGKATLIMISMLVGLVYIAERSGRHSEFGGVRGFRHGPLCSDEKFPDRKSVV